ncbi:MAG: antiterminator LoaP [Lachnospiraceae bacterium]|nr:antiterminator LoaP [Lachnospiraceae bacterium]
MMQVQTGTEEKIRTQCDTLIPQSVLQQCFIPYYEEQRKLHGKWNVLKKVLFPGYIFMVTDDLEELFFRLKRVQGMTKILGTGDEIVPLTEEEVSFMQRFGGEKQVVEISKGILEGNQVKILSGPLTGKEALIKKIDYHKRRAYLELEMFGRMQKICLGLEVKMEKVEKTEPEKAEASEKAEKSEKPEKR